MHARTKNLATMSSLSASTPRAELTLVIEASTASASVALLRGDALVQRLECAMGVSREDALFPTVQAALALAGVGVSALSAIACGSGPGSFTSLRIAAAMAKGLAQATGVPLYAVPSLLLAAATHARTGQYVVHADALRGERYAQAVTIDDALRVHADSEVVRVTTAALESIAADRHRLVVLGSSLASSASRVVPDAARLPNIFEWRERGQVSLSTWEPAYGRLAEAQVKWEATHGRSLSVDE